MTQDLSTKKYPNSTPEVSEMLGLSTDAHEVLSVSTENHGSAPAALPHTESHSHAAHAEVDLETIEEQEEHKPVYVKALKKIAPFVAIFAVGLFLYYFFFSGVDFSNLLKSTPSAQTAQESSLQQLQSQNLAAYNTWINGFYYDVSDAKITDPNTDNSGNGLSNFEKYLLNLNPKAYDSLGLGISDTEAISQGINPLTGNALTDAQKNVISKYIDTEVAMNRLTLNRMQNPSQVAGASTNTATPIRGSGNSTYIVPGEPTSTNTTNRVTNGDTANIVNINTSIPGKLEIPSLKITVPIIWSTDSNNFEKDLEAGVVHYPGTAMPGEIGTTYIAGHSSNYLWAKGNYNHAFTKLGDLALNTSFSITVTQTNG
ncbi:MAG TPA: sortase, partial [Candidatus Limnocylindria bacterium]|nr:sortase [Candidatus Limnocylindria bacterium]